MIKKVFIKNFGGISDLSFNCKKFNLFVGNSLQGKTTIIESLKWAVIGGNEDYYIKDGSDECEVKFETDTGILVERKKLRGGKSRLYLYKNGKPLESPQSTLDKVYHKFLFSPIDLIDLKPKEQIELLNSLLSKKLKISEDKLKEWDILDIDREDLKKDPIKTLEKYYKQKYDERTGINKVAANIKNSSMSSSVKLTETELKELNKELKQLNEEKDSIQQHNIKVEAAEKNKEISKSIKDSISKLEEEISFIEIESNFNIKENEDLLNKNKKELDIIKSDIIKKREEYKNKKETLDRINNNQIKCPISNSIICKTDMKPYVDSLNKEMEELSTIIKNKMSAGENLSKTIIKITSNIDNFKNLDIKKSELNRAKHIQENLFFSEESKKDDSKIVARVKEIETKLIEDSVRSQSNSITNEKEVLKLQKELDDKVKKIREIIDVKIPELTKINIPNVELNQNGLLYKGRPLTREGKSAQLRIATAILKDIDNSSNLYTLDEMERLDQHTLKKYIDGCCSKVDNIQYFGTYVGDIKFTLNDNCLALTIKQFKISD